MDKTDVASDLMEISLAGDADFNLKVMQMCTCCCNLCLEAMMLVLENL